MVLLLKKNLPKYWISIFLFNSRHKKEISKIEYEKISKSLYIDKVNKRFEELIKFTAFKKINHILENTSGYSLENLIQEYNRLRINIESKVDFPFISVIGHGDPCFANTMYNRITKTLRFIDPKGALSEDELWSNPYYDIAKLSHSICGRYDFFNNMLYEIRINNNFKCELEIPFDNHEFINIFRKKSLKMVLII